MPAIDNKTHTLLQGLSDFWTRFYADIDELGALYRGTEVLFAQTYLDMLSSFLNISIVETPLFNTELFKLLALREDQVLFDAGVNAAADRHRYDLPDNLVEAHILQNKVVDPTASFEKDAGYEIDATELELRFEDDPSGYPGRILATVLDGNLLTFGTGGNLKRFYVTSGAPFALAKPGHWFKIQNSAAGNNATYRVARVIDSNALLLQPATTTTITTPDPNTGSLKGELIDSGYTPATGFAHRVVQVEAGGSFDDLTTRQTTEIESWYPKAPVGLGVRKGDVIRILDLDAVPSIPLELDVALVRHDKLYLNADNAAEFDASPVTKYVVLREPANPDIVGELQTFAQVGTPKTGTQGSFLAGGLGTPAQASEEVIFETTATTLVPTDRQRFITIRNSAPITWVASIAADGTLTRTAGMENVFVRSAAGGSVTISGSSAVPSNNGTRTLQSLVNDNDAVLVGQVFVPETGLSVTLNGSPTQAFLEIIEGGARLDLVARVAGTGGNAITVEIATPAGGSTVVSVVAQAITVTPLLGGDTVANIAAAIQSHAAASNLVEAAEGLAGNITAAQAAANLIGGADSMTNGGTYRVKKYLNDHQLVLDLQSTFPDINNGSLYWTIHDGFQTTLTKSRLKLDSVEVFAGVGDTYTGGRRRPVENTDYTVNSETGLILQIGRHAGTWGVSPQAYFNYSWYLEILVVTAGTGVLDSTDTLVSVNETAMWAPDVLVDRFNLYNNYGYLINRFDASSETYREFIRGVFQLYILGPTLERLESALNVIAGFPVVRDDDEVLKGYDGTSDPDYNVVTTLRPNGDTATYSYPKSLVLRGDVQNPANVDVLTFESFEPLTLAFQTSDHVQDPSWWTNLIIPKALMPNESTGRRRTVSALIENIIGAWDNPRIGDPGLFIGADDEGNVPSFIGTHPAKRRKMANVVMERFLRWNIFFVRFDETVIDVLDADFIGDLLELILVAKPGYRYMFIEPLNRFEDTMLLTEDELDIVGRAEIEDAMVVGEDALTLQTFSWDIGDYWRFRPAVTGQALVVADGASVPNSGSAILLGEDHVITKVVRIGGAFAAIQEDVDYDMDYVNGELTPKTVWPAGTYTIDFRSVLVTPSVSSFDPSTDFSALSLPKYWGKMQCDLPPYAANPITFLSPGLRIDHQTEFFTAPVDQRTCGIKAQGWGFFWQATEAEGFCDIAVTFDNMVVSAGDCYAGIAVVADPRTSMRSAASPFTDVQWIVGVRRKYDGAATDQYELFCAMDADTRVIASVARPGGLPFDRLRLKRTGAHTYDAYYQDGAGAWQNFGTGIINATEDGGHAALRRGQRPILYVDRSATGTVRADLLAFDVLGGNIAPSIAQAPDDKFEDSVFNYGKVQQYSEYPNTQGQAPFVETSGYSFAPDLGSRVWGSNLLVAGERSSHVIFPGNWSVDALAEVTRPSGSAKTAIARLHLGNNSQDLDEDVYVEVELILSGTYATPVVEAKMFYSERNGSPQVVGSTVVLTSENAPSHRLKLTRIGTTITGYVGSTQIGQFPADPPLTDFPLTIDREGETDSSVGTDPEYTRWGDINVNGDVSAAGAPLRALGDTAFTIGAPDPLRVRSRREHVGSCIISTVGTKKVLTCPNTATDISVGLGLSKTHHNDAYIRIYAPASVAGLHRILNVLSSEQAVLYPGDLVDATGVEWAFMSEEPSDGVFIEVGGVITFESPSAIFRTRHEGRYIHVKDASNGANNKRHRITEVLSMSQAKVEAGAVAETDLHWRLEGTEQHMDLVERPLQITVT